MPTTLARHRRGAWPIRHRSGRRRAVIRVQMIRQDTRHPDRRGRHQGRASCEVAGRRFEAQGPAPVYKLSTLLWLRPGTGFVSLASGQAGNLAPSIDTDSDRACTRTQGIAHPAPAGLFREPRFQLDRAGSRRRMESERPPSTTTFCPFM